jgi:hypothetical protein
MHLDLTFRGAYSVSRLDELPQNPPLRQIYYPGASERGGSVGLWLLIEPDGKEPWVGGFAGGMGGDVWVGSMPDRRSLAVVSDGAGYIVEPSIPESWGEIPLAPVRSHCVVREMDLVVLGDFTGFIAYGRHGIA